MLIDCDSCELRDIACGDCVVTVLLGAPQGGVELGTEERRAIDVLAGNGLVPPLRLVLPDPAGLDPVVEVAVPGGPRGALGRATG